MKSQRAATSKQKRVAWKEEEEEEVMATAVKEEEEEEEEEERPKKKLRQDTLVEQVGERLDAFLDNSFIMHLSDAITGVNFTPIREALIKRIMRLSDATHGTVFAQRTIHDYVDDLAKRATLPITKLYELGYSPEGQKKEGQRRRNRVDEEEEKAAAAAATAMGKGGLEITFHHRRLHKGLFLPENSKKRSATEAKLIKQVWENEEEHTGAKRLLDDAKHTKIDLITVTLGKKLIITSLLPWETVNYELNLYRNTAADVAYQKLLGESKIVVKLLYDMKKRYPELKWTATTTQ